MEELSIEVILFIVLGMVFALDFVFKGLKKGSKKSDKVDTFKNSSIKTKPRSWFYPSIKNLTKRLRNIGLYLFLIVATKVCIHYYGYPLKYEHTIEEYIDSIDNGKVLKKAEPFTYYLENIFYHDGYETQFIYMWITSVVIISFLAWQISPYIKKR